MSAILLVPTKRMADNQAGAQLETIVPTEFGDWKLDQTAPATVINPSVAKQLAQLYSATLSRTYQNSAGQSVMLSIAYGADQRYANQIHKPEVCYPAQGFQISQVHKATLNLSSGNIPVMHLTAQQGERIEPITYWILLGQKLVRGAVELNLARVSYGLRGTIPDGLLFRVSTISNQSKEANTLQEQFIESLLSAIPTNQRALLIGSQQ